jgi:hypothetical protein
MLKIKLITILCAFILLPLTLNASGTITGTLSSPSTSVPIRSATLSFSLSQAGVDVTNTYNLATTPVYCATDSTGSVKGIADPLVAPSGSAVNSGGSLSGTYYAKYVYHSTIGLNDYTTNPSPVLSISVVNPNNAITFTPPTLHPQNATGYDIYVGVVNGSEKLQHQVVGFTSYTLTSFNGSGSALPTNNTVCSFTFNDAIIPSYTTYRVTVTDQRGNAISGFPQSWYLSGASVNIGSVIPISTNSARFQTPILSNPLSSYAIQSINSPLTLNDFNLSAGNLVIDGTSTLNGALHVTTGATTLDGGLTTTSSTINGRVNTTFFDKTSANNLTLGAANTNFIVGSAQINCLDTTGWQAGSIVTLVFESSITVKNLQSCTTPFKALNLAGAADFNAVNKGVLSLVLFEGSIAWNEVSRSVN